MALLQERPVYEIETTYSKKKQIRAEIVFSALSIVLEVGDRYIL